MRIVEILAVAFEAMGANKLRSFLTMLGIVIGVSAVIAMVALGHGAQQSVNDRIASLGTTLLSISPAEARTTGGIASASDRAPLTLEDANALEDRGTIIAAVQPELSRQMQLQFQSRNTNTTITGTSANYLEVRKFTLDAGRMFSSAEDAAKRRVAVVGAQVLQDLGISSPDALIGQDIRINTVQFEVVGVLASKGQGSGFANPDDQVLVPIQTAQYRLIGGNRLRSINVLAPSEAQIPATMAEIEKILRRQHRLRPGQDDNFQIRNQADFLSTLGATTQVFTLLLAGIAAVSLIVGGIGIMNIMLVSVTERTREIGIRKALGAAQTDILMQFMVEALALCMLGGVLGVCVGAGAALLLRNGFHWTMSVDSTSVLIALAFATAVGMVFGVWPARRAAALDPIEALRYE
jgi:putative ABC transport system permease protein